MKKKVKFVFFVCLILLSIGLVSASDIFFKGDINFRINDSYNAGGVIDTNIVATNNENFPISNGYLVIEILKGCEDPFYPSQASDCDNVFDEVIIPGINLAPQSSIEIPFSYQIPDNLKEGGYRIDTYFRTKKTPIMGIPHIFLQSKHKYFNINSTGDFPYAKILRTKTNLNNKIGPIGVGVSPGEEFELETHINSSKDRNANLIIELCEWEDTNCEPINKKEETINLKNEKFPIKMNAPEKPGAYAIRIELRDNGLVSLYRSRLIVHGETAKIRKMYPDKYYYNNEEATISFLIGGSPDHYNNPVSKNIILKTTFNNKDNNEYYDRNFSISSIESNEMIAKNFSIPIKRSTYFEICGELVNIETSEIYDEYCYEVDSSDFSSELHNISLDKNFEEDFFVGTLSIKDEITGGPVNAHVSLILFKNNSIIKKEEVNISGSYEISKEIDENENYRLKVYDKTTNQEKEFDINRKSPSEDSKSNEKRVYWSFIIILSLFIIIIIFILLKMRKRENESIK